jgi:hypothetical protein
LQLLSPLGIQGGRVDRGGGVDLKGEKGQGVGQIYQQLIGPPLLECKCYLADSFRKARQMNLPVLEFKVNPAFSQQV